MATENTQAPVDLARLQTWMDARGLGSGPLSQVTPLTGGTQNILLRFSRGEREFVLRRPPLHPRPHSGKIILREARLLAALKGTATPHPALIASCDDETVLGAVFYLMEPIDGFNATVSFSATARSSAEARRQMGFGLIDGLVALAAVDHNAVGLADFGKLDGFLERQVDRWASELEAYAKVPEWTGRPDLGDVEKIGSWLETHRPNDFRPGIIHGDYHIGNVIYDDGGRLLAIVDWEMATLGDPLVDLGRLLISWPEGAETTPFTMRVESSDNFPTRQELIARYAAASGRDLTHLPWFEILSCYKLGIILEGSHVRSQAGLADVATGKRLHASAVALLDKARAIIGSI